jgi:hypothetical protein
MACKQNDKGYSTGLKLSYLYGVIRTCSVDSLDKPKLNIHFGNGFTCDLSFLFIISDNFTFGLNFKNIPGLCFGKIMLQGLSH